MRRDLVRFFLLGLACSFVIFITVMLLGQDMHTATVALLTFYVLILLGILTKQYRQKAWRRRFGMSHDDNYYSHEMRCRMSKTLRRVPVNSLAGRSHRSKSC